MHVELHLPIAAARTVVRRMSKDDLGEFIRYRADAEVGRYQGWTPMSETASLAFLESMSRSATLVGGQWLQVAIADAATGALLGDIGVHPEEDFAAIELGFTLAAQHQGRGLATEAVEALIVELFRRTPAQVVTGLTDARNLASIALLERLGFQRLREQSAVFRGEPCTEYHYARRRAGKAGDACS